MRFTLQVDRNPKSPFTTSVDEGAQFLASTGDPAGAFGIEIQPDMKQTNGRNS
jgi:hypothetical protein